MKLVQDHHSLLPQLSRGRTFIPECGNKERVLATTSLTSASYQMTCSATALFVVATTSGYNGNYSLRWIWTSTKPSRSLKPWRLPSERLRTYSRRSPSRPLTLTFTLSEDDAPQQEDLPGRKDQVLPTATVVEVSILPLNAGLRMKTAITVARKATLRVCHTKAHDRRAGNLRQNRPPRLDCPTHQVTPDDPSATEYLMYHVAAANATKPYTVTLQVNQADLLMEIDRHWCYILHHQQTNIQDSLAPSKCTTAAAC